MLSNILDMAKIEAGVMEIPKEQFDIVELIESLYSTHLCIEHDKDIVFNKQIPHKSCLIDADAKRMAQVLTNFVTNAFKYTRRGHITIGYEITGKGVTIFTEDTGIGIPAEKLDQVFVRFEKLGSLKQGTGLGLSICKAYMDLCGGKLGAESTEGKGSRFWAWFPTKTIISD